MKLKLILTCISLSCSLALVSPAIAGSNEKNQIKKMQDHWEMVISEKDKNKRSKLINEHKKMMDDMNKSDSTHHHMGGMSGHNMNNTMDMHRSMIKIIE